MSRVYLLLGSNMGDRRHILMMARAQIQAMTGSVVRLSSIYETEPWGFDDAPDFLNQALIVETDHSPRDVLEQVLSIERRLGRERLPGMVSRILDIDILFYDDLVMNEPDFIIPHPRLPQRRFALVPMDEIAGDYIHPALKKPIAVLLARCRDRHRVTRYPDEWSEAVT
jgi:2-amino-4-hydroxy-6-hydroxymethyldihydropteridine diphosphokinase